MTAKQLKTVTAYATICNVQLTHVRTGYFINVVTIGEQSYTDHEKVIARLKELSFNQQRNGSVLQLS